MGSTKIIMSIVGIVMLAMAFMMFPIVLDGANDILTDDSTVTASITTGVGELEGDVVFTIPLYNNSTANIDTVTSSDVGDTPVAGTYTAATDTLNVTGLIASTTRDITVTYTGEATANFTGLDSLVSIGPTLIFVFLLFGGIGLSGYSGYSAVRKRRSGGGNSSNSTRY